MAHIRHTFGFSGTTEDLQIYELATRENRIIVTQDGDFKKLISPKAAGVFIIPSYLTTTQIDQLLSEFIVGKDPGDFMGRAIKIQGV